MRVITAGLLLCCSTFGHEGVEATVWESPRIRQGQYVLWHDPGAVESLDFRYGAGGQALAPRPPFTFIDEDSSGSTPKVKVRDAEDRRWSVKFGDEASPETFCTRVAWALGYLVPPTYFVAEGTIEGVRNLRRARKAIDDAGHFEAARFQLRTKDPKFLKTVTWRWDDNPFVGTPELSGLKILMMLLSDWDNKDARDAETRGTNTGIYQHGELLYYFIDDWGGAMGRWGKYYNRSKWDAGAFLKQSRRFLTIDNGNLRWGYVGQHPALLTADVKFTDIRWLLQYLGRVTDNQLRDGLTASGASENERDIYVEALRMRIAALQNAVR